MINVLHGISLKPVYCKNIISISDCSGLKAIGYLGLSFITTFLSVLLKEQGITVLVSHASSIIFI